MTCFLLCNFRWGETASFQNKHKGSNGLDMNYPFEERNELIVGILIMMNILSCAERKDSSWEFRLKWFDRLIGGLSAKK